MLLEQPKQTEIIVCIVLILTRMKCGENWKALKKIDMQES